MLRTERDKGCLFWCLLLSLYAVLQFGSIQNNYYYKVMNKSFTAMAVLLS